MALHPVAKLADLPPGARIVVRVGKIEVGLFNVDGTVHAYRNVCPHAGAPVCVGKISGTTLPSAVYEYAYGLEGCILRCPWHGWEFDLRTGEHLVDPATRLKKIAVTTGSSTAEHGSTGAAPFHENLEAFAVQHVGDDICVTLPAAHV